MTNTRDLILAANDRKTVKVPTPEWGCDSVYVRSLSAAERSALAQRVRKMNGTPDEIYIDGTIAAVILSDEAGNRIFADDHAKQLADKSGPVLDRIVKAYRKLNALDASEVKEIEGKS